MSTRSVLQFHSVFETPEAAAKTPQKIREIIKMPVPPIDRVANAEVGVVGLVCVTVVHIELKSTSRPMSSQILVKASFLHAVNVK